MKKYKVFLAAYDYLIVEANDKKEAAEIALEYNHRPNWEVDDVRECEE